MNMSEKPSCLEKPALPTAIMSYGELQVLSNIGMSNSGDIWVQYNTSLKGLKFGDWQPLRAEEVGDYKYNQAKKALEERKLPTASKQ